MTGFRRELEYGEFKCYITNPTASLKSFSGATSTEVTHYVVPTLQQESSNSTLIHLGGI